MLRRMNDFAKMHDLKLSAWKNSACEQSTTTSSRGNNFVIDNLDLRQNVINMTEENQNSTIIGLMVILSATEFLATIYQTMAQLKMLALWK